MGVVARMKSIHNGQPRSVTSAATITLTGESDNIYLSGTATVTSLLAPPETRGRITNFYQDGSGSTTLTNSPGTTTAGQMDLGSKDPGNVVLGPTDTICLHLRMDGTWIRYEAQTDN